MTKVLIIGRKPQKCGKGVTWIDCDADALIFKPHDHEITDFHVVIFWPTERYFALPREEDARKYPMKVTLKWQTNDDFPATRTTKPEERDRFILEKIHTQTVPAARIVAKTDVGWIQRRCDEQMRSLLDAAKNGLYLFVIVPQEIDVAAFSWLGLRWNSIPRPPQIVKKKPPLYVNSMVPVLEQFSAQTWGIEFDLAGSAPMGFRPFHITQDSRRNLSVVRLMAKGGVAVLPAPATPDDLLEWISGMSPETEKDPELLENRNVPSVSPTRDGLAVSQLKPPKNERPILKVTEEADGIHVNVNGVDRDLPKDCAKVLLAIYKGYRDAIVGTKVNHFRRINDGNNNYKVSCNIGAIIKATLPDRAELNEDIVKNPSNLFRNNAACPHVVETHKLLIGPKRQQANSLLLFRTE